MRAIFIVSLFLTTLVAAASPLPDFPFVYAFGSANREVAPDKATIEFRVKSYDTQAERAYTRQSEVADELITFAEKLSVPANDIVARPIEKIAIRREDDQGNPLEILGYQAVRSVQIQLNDLARFPELIEFLYRQSHVEGISVTFESRNETVILQELTEEACRSARAKAERLTKGFDRELGNIRAISEDGFTGMGRAFGLPGEEVGHSPYVTLGAATKRDFRAIPGTISFQKGVYAIFAIE